MGLMQSQTAWQNIWGFPERSEISRVTARQVYLSQDRRLKNLKGAFRLHRKNVSGKRILLIDDVMTTGATCNEVARLLRRHGAKSVAVAVIARQGLNTPRKIA